MAVKKKRRKITKPKAPSDEWLKKVVAKCAYCGKTKPILSIMIEDGDDGHWKWDSPPESDKNQCRDCFRSWLDRGFRTKRMLAEARDRLRSKLTPEKAKALHAQCVEDEDTLTKWEVKLGLKESE